MASGQQKGATMKIKAEHFKTLRDAIAPVLDSNQSLTKDKLLNSTRERWGIMWQGIDPLIRAGTFSFTCEHWRDFNDNHIDTALKAIIKEHYLTSQ